ncbi:MAG: PqqD family protein [Methanoregula sp.]|nr:PqqD family protein [Methanoregula sp.]
MDAIHSGKIPIPNPAIVSRDAPDGGKVMVNCDTGSAVAVNPTGALIWSLIDGKRAPGEIADSVCRHFGAAPETVRADVDALLATFSEDGFVGYEIPDVIR